jgi:hypothetical protein
MSPPSGPFTFSRPLASPAALTEALHRRAREQMLGFRASLGGVSDAASAQAWVSGYGAATVRRSSTCPLFGSPHILQRRFLDAAAAVGANPDTDEEASQLSVAARDALFNYAVASWIDTAPYLVTGMEDVLRGLPAGETFGGFPVASPAPASAPSPSVSSAAPPPSVSSAAPPPSTPAPSQLSAPAMSRESSTGSASRGRGAVRSVPVATPPSRQPRSRRGRKSPPASDVPLPFGGLSGEDWALLVKGGAMERPKSWTSVRPFVFALPPCV